MSIEEGALEALKFQVVRDVTEHMLSQHLSKAASKSKGTSFEEDIQNSIDTLYRAIDNLQGEVDSLKSTKSSKGMSLTSIEDF